MEHSLPVRKWNLRGLLLCHILIAILMGSLFWPATSGFWGFIDTHCFYILNNTLENNPNWQLFWALANHELADWVEDLFILGFFIAYVRSCPKERRLRCIAELIIIIALIAVTILFINRALFRDLLSFKRASPTWMLDAIHLSEEIPWLYVKDHSSKSFPADHATTAILFATTYAIHAKRKLGLFAILYAVFLCMPRLITGAHWLSDILVGSCSIILFSLSWTYFSPLHSYVTYYLERLLRIRSKRATEST